ncbi:sensor histidine kinase [Streptomonospora salina]|uniref:histidine kinase n=1 Tax=Streptomonospora salina TaxID=104205 RepID=A0A841EIC3_9ACTN|nr:histidine kinase [Streptomonospora salina]MBB6001129.1 signal transduction histidine kinase [Streptomonospora salina]
MRGRPPGRELLDHPLLGGRAYLGSALWAGAMFALGLLLWGVGAYFWRDGIGPHWLLATLAAVCGLMLFRRTAPGAVLGAATLVLAVDAAIGPSSAVIIVYGDALYAACVWGRRRSADTVLALVCAGGVAVTASLAAALMLGAFRGGLLELVQVIGLYVLVFASPVISGLSVREHRQRTALERERARQIERMAELDRRNAVTEERGRVARELHDVIANHLSAVAVQSTAALSMREADPARMRRILGVIRDSSLHGLTDMRAMIRVLRDEEGGSHLDAVTPRLSDADRFFADAREAGVEVEVAWPDGVPPLPPRADAAAYRVLQESLTNALRYAHPRRVEVVVDVRAGDAVGRGNGREDGIGAGETSGGRTLVVSVSNGVAEAGEGATGVLHGQGAGAGLTGMRERVLLLGGRFSAGPVDARTWRVRAEIPLSPAEQASGAEPRGSAADGGAAQDPGGAGAAERPAGAEDGVR